MSESKRQLLNEVELDEFEENEELEEFDEVEENVRPEEVQIATNITPSEIDQFMEQVKKEQNEDSYTQLIRLVDVLSQNYDQQIQMRFLTQLITIKLETVRTIVFNYQTSKQNKFLTKILDFMQELSDEPCAVLLYFIANLLYKDSQKCFVQFNQIFKQSLIFISTPNYNQTYLTYFYVTFIAFLQNSSQKLRAIRAILKQALNTDEIQYLFLKQLFNNMNSTTKQNAAINLVRQLNTFATLVIARKKQVTLFSTTVRSKNKIDRTTKNKIKQRINSNDNQMKNKISKEISLEEYGAEKLSQNYVYYFLKLIIQQIDIINDQALTYAFTETILYIINYLLQYQRCFPFVINVCKLFIQRKGNYQYIPLQQLFLIIMTRILHPMPRRSLEINPAQYKAKMYDQNGFIQFKNQLCVPRLFSQTLVFREQVFKELIVIIQLYFLQICRNAAISLPEASQAFVVHLNELLKTIENQHHTNLYLGYSFQYSGFMINYVKTATKQIKQLKQILQSDIQYIIQLRICIDVATEASSILAKKLDFNQLQLVQLFDKQLQQVQEEEDDQEQIEKHQSLQQAGKQNIEQLDEKFDDQFEEEQEEECEENDVLRELKL